MAEQVICVDDSLPDRGRWFGDPVEKGRIYTIRGKTIPPLYPHKVGVLLEEVSAGYNYGGGDIEAGYDSSRFRPIKDENIEQFREMDREIFKPKKVDA